jgi:hypothetical protein
MIIQHKENTIVRSEQFTSQACTIDAMDMRYIARLLRNNYSDTILATMREIVANALDVTSKRKPEITLPTSFQPNFIVRDFGVGLSEEDMLGLYTKYGKSTKRGANNAIGGFGIGRFAPLSYTSSFIVTSIFEGYKTSYSILIDEFDDTVVTKIYSCESNEPTGISVQVPIANDDVTKFREKFRLFSAFIQDKINVKSANYVHFELNPMLSNEVFDLFGEVVNSWGLRRIQAGKHSAPFSGAGVLMGGVFYPVTPDSERDAFCSGLVYKAKIGEFDLHHGRENLEYSERTRKALVTASQKIKDAFIAYACDHIANAENTFDAKVKLKDIKDFISRLNCVNVGITYKGEAIDTNVFEKIFGSYQIARFEPTFSNPISIRKARRWQSPSLEASHDTFFVVDDDPSPKALQSRLSFLKEGEKAVICKTDSDDKLEKAKEVIEKINHKNVRLLSQLDRKAIVRSASRKKGENNLSRSDILKLKTEIRRYTNIANCWEAVGEIDNNKTYYYVRYNANKVNAVGSEGGFLPDCPRLMSNYLDTFNDLTGENIDVYGVRGVAMDKIAKMKNWIPFESIYESKILASKKFIQKARGTNFSREMADRDSPTFLDLNFYSIKNDLVPTLKKIGNKSVELKNFLELFDLYESDNFIDSINDKLFAKVSCDDLVGQMEAFEAKYPLVDVYAQCHERHTKDYEAKVITYFSE